MTTPQQHLKYWWLNKPRWLSFLQSQGILSVIALTMLSAPFVPAPAASLRWHGAQTLTVEVGAIVSLAFLLRRIFFDRVRSEIIFALPLVFLYASLVWDLFSWVHSGESRFVTQGFLLFASGVIVAVVVAAQARMRPSILFLTDTLTVAGLLVAFSGIVLYGTGSTPLVVGVLHDHALFGAFIMLLIPMALATSIAPVAPGRRLFAQASLAIYVTAMLMAQTRSSWIGCVAALLTFSGLLFSVKRATPRKNDHSNKWQQVVQGGMIPVLAVLAVGCFVWLSPDRDTLCARVRTLTTTVVRGRDVSTEWRFTAWAGAKAMIRRKPLMGWGIGSYPRYQYSFTHVGQSAEVVAMRGPTISDETHNSYLQIWVETGLIGLILWVGFLLSFFIVSAHSLRSLVAGGLEQRLMIGSLSAVVGQAIDAFANPAWQFGHITLPYWIIIGLAISITRQQRAASAFTTISVKATAKPGWFQQLVQSTAMLFVVVVLLWLVLQTASALPAPYL